MSLTHNAHQQSPLPAFQKFDVKVRLLGKNLQLLKSFKNDDAIISLGKLVS